MLRLLLTLLLASCATAPPVVTAPTDDELARRAETEWQQRVANGVVHVPRPAPEHDFVSTELVARLDAANCRLTLDTETGVLRLGDTALFFPSADFSAALADDPARPGLVNPMPTRALDGILLGLDVADARETLWFVSCGAPHKPERYLRVEGADFSRAAIHPSGTSLVFLRDGIFELPLMTGVPTPLRLTQLACPTPSWRPELWTPDGIVADLTCDTRTRVVLAPSPAGWRPTPYVEVTALALDPKPATSRGAPPGPWLYLGLHDARGKLFRSRDLGDTWETVDLDPNNPTTSAEDIIITTRFIAVRTARVDHRGGEVMVSSNRKTFARARRPFGDTPTERLWLSDRGNLLAGHLDAGTWRVVESNDLGRTWHPTTTAPPPRAPTFTLPDGSQLEPGVRGLWKRRPHGSRALVYPGPAGP